MPGKCRRPLPRPPRHVLTNTASFGKFPGNSPGIPREFPREDPKIFPGIPRDVTPDFPGIGPGSSPGISQQIPLRNSRDFPGTFPRDLVGNSPGLSPGICREFPGEFLWYWRAPGPRKNLCFYRFLGSARPRPFQKPVFLQVFGTGAPPALAKLFIGCGGPARPRPWQKPLFF